MIEYDVVNPATGETLTRYDSFTAAILGEGVVTGVQVRTCR